MRQFITRLAGESTTVERKKVRQNDRRGQHSRLGGGQHPGLLLQRYLCESATGDGGNPEEKRAILQAAINAAKNSDVQELYRKALDRWRVSLPELTASNELQTQGRLIVGLGSENVLETGIRLHHTYGLPILPGSALKGLAAHYCDQVWGPSNPKFRKPTPTEEKAYRKYLAGKSDKPPENYHRLLFGATDDSGCIVFHDAWFVFDEKKDKEQTLLLDVMTPHHPNWLDGTVPPTDFDSPIPVPFLSVAGRFHVAVSWHGPENYKPENYNKSVSWTNIAFDLLLDALCGPEKEENGKRVRDGGAAWGIGGKTTSGYGRLIEIDPRRRRKPFSAAAQGLPSVGAEIEATLLDAPKKNPRRRARIKLPGEKERSGPIDGTAPATAKTGDVVQLIVKEVTEQTIEFTWPQRAKK